MASITLFISWVSINKNLAIADKQYLLLCGLNSSVTRRLARKCSCFSCLLATIVQQVLVAGSCVQLQHITFTTRQSDSQAAQWGQRSPFLFEAVFWLYGNGLCVLKNKHLGFHKKCSKSFNTSLSAGSLYFFRNCIYVRCHLYIF